MGYSHCVGRLGRSALGKPSHLDRLKNAIANVGTISRSSKKSIIMSPSLSESADIQGKIDFSIGRAFLFADEHRLYIRAPLARYQFAPNEVIAIEETGERSIGIKHTRPEYPDRIVFYSKTISAATMMSIVANKGYTPAATINDMLSRDSLSFRPLIVFPFFLLFWSLLFLLPIVLFVWSILTNSSFQFNRSTVATILMLMFSGVTSIRFFPPAQWLVMRPGRNIGEIKPVLNFLMLMNGLLAAANIALSMGIPGILVLVLVFSALWAIEQIDMRLFQ